MSTNKRWRERRARKTEASTEDIRCRVQLLTARETLVQDCCLLKAHTGSLSLFPSLSISLTLALSFSRARNRSASLNFSRKLSRVRGAIRLVGQARNLFFAPFSLLFSAVRASFVPVFCRHHTLRQQSLPDPLEATSGRGTIEDTKYTRALHRHLN